ncbi:helix-turn-helix domain-containing protein, partial [Garciella nitratireducens]
MKPKKKHSFKSKLNILQKHLCHDISITELSGLYQVSEITLRKWLYRYETNGVEGLKDSKTWKKYSKEVKESAVLDYLSGKYSHKEILIKYEIRSSSVLQNWIKQYNSHRKLKDTGEGMSNSMIKSRKTTVEERIAIVLSCIENNYNYQQTAYANNVSYQQVYYWVKKYKIDGDKALHDSRGKRKEEARMSDEDKNKIQMRKLEKENECLRAENDFFVSFIQKYKDKYTVKLMCKVLKFPRSTYYKVLNH